MFSSSFNTIRFSSRPPYTEDYPQFKIEIPKSSDRIIYRIKPHMFEEIANQAKKNKAGKRYNKAELQNFINNVGVIAEKIRQTTPIPQRFLDKTVVFALCRLTEIDTLLSSNKDTNKVSSILKGALSNNIIQLPDTLEKRGYNIIINNLTAPSVNNTQNPFSGISKDYLHAYKKLVNLYNDTTYNPNNETNFNSSFSFPVDTNSSHIRRVLKSLGFTQSIDRKKGTKFTDSVPSRESAMKAFELLSSVFQKGYGNQAVIEYVLEKLITHGYGVGGTQVIPILDNWTSDTGLSRNVFFVALNKLAKKGLLVKSSGGTSPWMINADKVAELGLYGRPLPWDDPKLPGHFKDLFTTNIQQLSPNAPFALTEKPKNIIDRVTDGMSKVKSNVKAK